MENHFDNNTSLKGGGQDESRAAKVWTTIALSEARIEFLNRLVCFRLGIREVEELTEKLTDKFRSEKFKKNKGRECVKLGREFMRLKLQDEKAFHGEKMVERNRMMEGIMKSMGENTRRTKTFIKYLRNEAMRVKSEAREKYEKKLRFLKTKYGGESMDDRMEKPPKGLEIYGEAKIFSRHKYDESRR